MLHYIVFILLIRSWCVTCETLVKLTCLDGRHQTHSLLEEAEESQAELDEVLNG